MELPRHNNGLLRLCTNKGCPLRHYENCPDCFGFGLIKCAAGKDARGHEHGGLGQEGWPASAAQASDDPLPACAFAFQCPSCLSTLKGAPA